MEALQERTTTEGRQAVAEAVVEILMEPDPERRVKAERPFRRLWLAKDVAGLHDLNEAVLDVLREIPGRRNRDRLTMRFRRTLRNVAGKDAGCAPLSESVGSKVQAAVETIAAS